jgi:hypothetical protein
MEPKDIIAALFSGVTAFVAIFNWRGSRFRPKLKDDLEIMKKLREELSALGKTSEDILNNEHYKLLQNKVERKIHRAYGQYGTDVSDAVSSVALLVAGIFILSSPSLRGSLWPVGVASLVVSAYLGFQAIKDRGKPRDD